MKKANLRLTDAEIDALWEKAPRNMSDRTLSKLVADAATDKALRGIVVWLRDRARNHSFGHEADALDDAADELEAMLNEEAHSG